MKSNSDINEDIKNMTKADFEQREANIKQQAARKRRLLKLVQIFHRCRSGSFDDYADTYEEFYNTYLAPRPELETPRYASAAEDESYGLITLYDSLTEALNNQANLPGSGEYLNVPAGIYDLDSRGTKQIETCNVTMTTEAYTMLCGLVAHIINNDGIYGPWDELRTAFPLQHFRQNVVEWDGLTDPPAKGVYYDQEAEL